MRYPGWDTPEAVAAGRCPVAVLDHATGPLIAEPDPPIRVTRGVAAVAVRQRGPGRYIADFGQNLIGRVRLTVRGAAAGPCPVGVSPARAEQETTRGRAECGWALADGRLTITATVPPGATAHLEVPTSDPAGVREGGEAAANRPGVLAVEPIDTGALLHLASGHYIVSAAAPDTQTPPVNSRPVLFSRETS
ncbi:alpha-L-rhamnosidase C-terminal domain-containing protein [Streptomyces niveus]|uniref:alpha-L-rhamnosidase C-terminal domain-containing protein n=1 Tax=Streptomyces niveus TaxID=193462 RepID=UPI003642216E